jgi:CTP:molybdopterin cytidylyltransferase MocA
VILAAGGGSRFVPSTKSADAPNAPHKLLAPWRDRPLVAWAIEHALGAALPRTWVVTGSIDLTSVIPPGVEVLANPRWAEGQATSLQVAIAAARRSGVDAIVVGLGDQPLIPAGAWRAVAMADADPPVAVATYGGRRRNPVRLTEAVWELLPSGGDEGARTLIRDRPELVQEVPCDGDPADIDTVEDLSRLTSRS